MSDVHGISTCSSWLVYYLGCKNENELDYPMLTKKNGHITATAMW